MTTDGLIWADVTPGIQTIFACDEVARELAGRMFIDEVEGVVRIESDKGSIDRWFVNHRGIRRDY